MSKGEVVPDKDQIRLAGALCSPGRNLNSIQEYWGATERFKKRVVINLMYSSGGVRALERPFILQTLHLPPSPNPCYPNTERK